jgi:hypothetical protein
LDFDRINNDGHYEPGNLQLCSRSANLLNRRDSANSLRQRAADFLAANPTVKYAMATIRNMMNDGLTTAEIMARWKKNGHLKGRWKPVTNPLLPRSEIFAKEILPPANTQTTAAA